MEDVIKRLLGELKLEAYGERSHGGKQMSPNIFHFKRLAEEIFKVLMNNSSGNISYQINDIERDLMLKMDYAIGRRQIDDKLYNMLLEFVDIIENAIRLIT
mgnify:FL=1